MRTYISFLRGINVAGKNIIKMAELKILLENHGLKEVSTYLQSGNVITRSEIEDSREVSKRIEEIIARKLKMEVPVLSFDLEGLNEILQRIPYTYELKNSPDNLYFTLLFGKPDPQLLDSLWKSDFAMEN